MLPSEDLLLGPFNAPRSINNRMAGVKMFPTKADFDVSSLLIFLLSQRCFFSTMLLVGALHSSQHGEGKTRRRDDLSSGLFL